MFETAPGRPALDEGQVHLWRADINAASFLAGEQSLDATELDRAGQFRFPADARRFRAARLLLRQVLAAYLDCEPREIAYGQGPRGKPCLSFPAGSSLKFNLSRSGDLALVAVARMEVGVDVEKIDPAIPAADIARSFFSPGEQSLLETLSRPDRAPAFYRLWTRKEALMKATGEGLGELNREVDVRNRDVFTRLGRTWHLRDIFLLEGYACALATEGEAAGVQVMGGDALIGSR